MLPVVAESGDACPGKECVYGSDGVAHPPWSHEEAKYVECVVSVVSQGEWMDDRVIFNDDGGREYECACREEIEDIVSTQGCWF